MLILISICNVMILGLTNWRPLGYSHMAGNVNEFISTLSYSIIGANLFYCFNDYLPSLSRRYVSKEYINHQLWKVKEQLRLLVEFDLHPFVVERKVITEDTYMADFESTNLNEPSLFGVNRSKADVINGRKDVIVGICNELLSSYLTVLTEKQLDLISSIFSSAFVTNGLVPTLWDENDRPIVSYNDNQKEIGQCIYSLYKLSIKQLL